MPLYQRAPAVLRVGVASRSAGGELAEPYQQFSGGSRAYRVLVFSPSGKLIFYRRGYASPTVWTFWHIRATRVGNYHTTYKVKNSSGQWSRYRTVTRSQHC